MMSVKFWDIKLPVDSLDNYLFWKANLKGKLLAKSPRAKKIKVDFK